MHPYQDIWLLLLAGLGTLYVIPGRATGVYFHLDELIRYEGLNIAHKRNAAFSQDPNEPQLAAGLKG